ncbi:MAG: hypothetical protein HDR13_05990 [Lachnospiraceae bacterium]|nr:hypothetical protein [Lachnospiraceae bacterium]
MRQVIEEILNGKFNFDNGSLDFSCPRIEISLHADETAEGSFTVYGPVGRMTEGYAVSSDLRMECVTQSFSGSQDEIHYRFDAHGMEEGEEVKGAFNIISNQGEYYLPFSVSVMPKVVVSSMGNIRNLFHFTNLAKSNWEEAVKLFYSEEFKEVFTGNDSQHYAAYQGLSAVRGNEHNVEEFLQEINKKRAVEYIPEETEIKIEDPLENTRYALVINRNGWGYTYLQIGTEGEFLRVEERNVTDSSFLGNIYRVYYYIDYEKLHAGNNYGCILLMQEHRTIRVPVTVVLHRTGRKALGIHREKRRLTVEVMEYYQAFRLKKISTKTWMAETGKLLSRLTELDDRDITIKLFQAQILLTEERSNEARWMIEKQEDQVLARREEFPELWCYYLYLTTLYSKDDQYVDDVAAEVAEVYERNRGNWRIAWLLLYLSEKYVTSAFRKWELLEELFRSRCTSPVIYIEAWNLLRANPSMLLKLEEFEQQVLYYAVRHDLMKDEIEMQIIYLAQKQKTYSDGIFRILKGCYEKKQDNDILHAICTLLIKGNRYGEAYFEWYRAGVEQNLRITRLYEYYMMSISLTYDGPLPKIVLMYFAYQSDLQYEITAYLYAYVYRHREEIPDIYVNYAAAMERFVTEQIGRGRINKELAYLYRNMISLPMIDEESAGQLATLLFMRNIKIDSDKIREVILVYPYGVSEEVYPVVSGTAQVPVYDSDCKILLGDGTGNRYTVSVEYQADRLISPAKLALMIAPFVRDHLGYAVYACFEYQNTFTVQEDNADLFARLVDSDRIKESMKREIRRMLVQFYYEKDRMRELDEYLTLLTPEDVTRHDRKEIIRYMITRGMYEEAYRWVRRYGPYGVEAKTLVKLCSRLLDEEQTQEDPVMTGVLLYVVKKGKYDENVMNYLLRYFSGSIKDMRDVWKAASDFGLDTYMLCERMLVQMLYTGAHVGEKMEIFRTYSKGGGNEELMAAFLSQCCYDYAIGEQITEPYIFRNVLQLYQDGVSLHLVCKIACLRYYAENKDAQDETVRQICCDFLRELVDEHIVLPLYKEYQGYIPQMDAYQDKTMVEYRAKAGSRAVIHYVIQSENSTENEYRKEEMKNMFGGICVKEFILFFGERLQFYITEEMDGNEQLTKSGTINKSDIGQDNFESRFTVLNDIMIGKTLQDYDTVDDLLREYYRQDYMTDAVFGIR